MKCLMIRYVPLATINITNKSFATPITSKYKDYQYKPTRTNPILSLRKLPYMSDLYPHP